MNNELAESIMAEKHEEYKKISKDLKELLNAATKRVTVKIDTGDLPVLKDGKYALCFAKKVGDFDYDVVWKSITKYAVNNAFSWQPIYDVYGTNTFEDKLKVEVSTNDQLIGLGEITTIDKYGVLSEPVTGGASEAINVLNNFDNIHIGISQVSVNESGVMESTPIYVSKGPVVLGESSYKPVEKVLVWFQANVETGTMFAEMRSNAIEIDLTGKESASVMYKNGQWAFI